MDSIDVLKIEGRCQTCTFMRLAMLKYKVSKVLQFNQQGNLKEAEVHNPLIFITLPPLHAESVVHLDVLRVRRFSIRTRSQGSTSSGTTKRSHRGLSACISGQTREKSENQGASMTGGDTFVRLEGSERGGEMKERANNA